MIEKKLSYYSAILLLMYSISCIAQTPAKKIYPPYPDVWGYDISEFPAMKWGSAGVLAYAMDDGDIWFVVDYSYKQINPMNSLTPMANEQYMLIKFFTGEQTILNAQERNKLSDITEGKEIFSGLYPEDIHFSDGSKLKIHHGHSPKRCFVPDFYRNYLIKTDPQGKEKKYSILIAAPQVDILPDEANCEAQGAPFLYQKLYALTGVIPLKDDTFIVFENSSNLILRFDKDFKTAFKPVTPVMIYNNYIMRNFFVIDYSLIENFQSKFIQEPVPLYQSIHDALLLHFHELYHE